VVSSINAWWSRWRPWRRRQPRVHTPTVLQMEIVDCGAAALGIILAYYGRIVPLAQLRQACGVSRDGSNAAHIMQVAQHHGLVARAFKKTLQGVQELRCPYIVFWNFNHFVVVEGFRHHRVYLNDPSGGRRTVTLEEFDAAFTGVVLAMEPGPTFTPGGRPPSMLHALRTRLQESVGALVYCCGTGVLVLVPSLVLPVFTQIFVDAIVSQGVQEWLRPLLGGMLLAAVLRGLLQRLQLRALRRLQRKLAVQMGSHFVWHLLHLPSSFYAQRYAGDLAQRTRLTDTTAQVLSGRLATTGIDLFLLLGYAVVMGCYDVLLTAIGMGCAVVNVLALRWVERRRVDANMRWLQAMGKAEGVAIDGLYNMEMLKASALESDFFARWAGYYAQGLNAQQALSVTSQTLGVLPTLLTSLASLLVLTVGGLRVMEGSLSLGMLVAFQSLMYSFLLPVTTLVNLGGTLQELRGDMQRLDDVLRYPTDPSSGEAPAGSLRPATWRLQGAVELRQVTFGYSRSSPPLIDRLSVNLKPGQWVALVGASGSGKSTLARLVCGLYEPWEGTMLFDGMPRSQIPRPVLTRSIALVDQDLSFFAGTVRDNLTLWDTTVPESQLVQACQDATVHDTVLAMAGGYDGTLLEGATNLSGGQRQRLEIARALLHNPALVVLDEATSALDADTEQQIVRHLRQRGCSCLIVAHRLSTIRDCDEIIVLEHGEVVQRGTHATLLQEGGAYLRLLQSEGEALEGLAS
jgi:NHLM bacteriocin system ABC transporter peptidase/ATP-binding protein